jgi:hypothetical protein
VTSTGSREEPGTRPDLELGAGAEVTFRLAGGAVIRARVRDGFVELDATGPAGGSDAVLAEPAAANVRRISVRGWG